MERRPVTPLKIAVVASGRQQKDIAARCGLSEPHLSRIVNGLHCDDRTRSAIASELGLTVDELFPLSTNGDVAA